MADDFIRREDALKRIDGIWDCADMVFEPNDHCCNMDDCASCKWRETKDAIRRIIEHTPAADVRPVVHARWVHGDYGPYCSACDSYPPTRKRLGYPGETEFDYAKFCPGCGAMIDLEG